MNNTNVLGMTIIFLTGPPSTVASATGFFSPLTATSVQTQIMFHIMLSNEMRSNQYYCEC